MTDEQQEEKTEDQQEKFNWGHFLLAGVFVGSLLSGLILPRVFGVHEAGVERWIIVCILPFLIFILWKHK